MRWYAQCSLLVLLSTSLCYAVELPNLRDAAVPIPAPELPAEFDTYLPPLGKNAPVAGAPGISQWTRTGGVGEHLILAGYNFCPANDPEGKKTSFGIYAQNGTGRAAQLAEVVALDPHQAIIRIPQKIPDGSMLLVFPRNVAGTGRPVAVNRTELWYVLPRTASPGEKVAAYGRNLTHLTSSGKSWVYLKPKNAETAGPLLAVEKSNPYKVDFEVPRDLAPGEYEVWLHNGHGGRYGWSALHRTEADLAPTHLKVIAPPAWEGPRFNVVELGANGEDDKDDTVAILKALQLATAEKRATVFFPAGTYYLSKPIAPVKDHTRLLGEGMTKTYIKGNPASSPNNLVHITGGHVELRDLVLDFNRLGEKQKFYRDADRGEHNPQHYQWLAKVKAAEVWKKQKANQGKPLPPDLVPPAKPDFPDVDRRHALLGNGTKNNDKLLSKKGYAPGLRLINCVLDAERSLIGLTGIIDGTIENCDIVARECQLGVPQYTTIRDCNFYGRADAPVLMYLYGGWCLSVHGCTGQDYMPNTFDTCMGRFFTVSAYGNRHENVYIGGNRTKDLTVNPMHFNQNSGEQIMWEFMPIADTLKPTATSKTAFTVARPLKQEKLSWYSDAIVVAGKGQGQYRRIAKYDENSRTVTLEHPWNVVPDEESLIQIGRPIRRIVVYDNYLDGKPRAAQSESHIASAGVEPFGASVDLTVHGNTFHELRAGVATFSPYLFHYYVDNTCEQTRTGFSIHGGTGLVARRNRVQGAITSAFNLTKGGENGLAFDVFELNRGANMPVAVHLGDRFNKPVQSQKLLLYRNQFQRGSGTNSSVGIRAPSESPLVLHQNRFEGFAKDIGQLDE